MVANDPELFDDLSRINNELVSMQRRLAQSNLELQKLAAENARLYAEAQEALRVQQAFLSILAHDLKTPLTTIVGNAQLLERWLAREGTCDPAHLLPRLQMIEASAHQMTAQINRLLEIACHQQGEVPEPERQALDLVALVHQVRTELQPTSPQITITVQTPLASLVGHWDRGQLERLLHNLVSNAIKYSPAGGQIIVELATTADSTDPAGLAVLQVRDQGIGIPPADLPHIFELFRRGGNTLGRIDGTGIGLFSVRHIVEQHGGTVAVESTEDVGTAFTARLPRRSP